MPELIYPTRTKIRGPILISAASLRELDSILAEQMQSLRSLQSQMVEERVDETIEESRKGGTLGMDVEEERKRYRKIFRSGHLGNESTSLVLYFSNGGRLKAKSFQEAAAHAEISQNLATSFNLSVECGTISLRMTAESDSFDTELTLDVSPSDVEASKNLFSALKRWLREIQAPRLQQWWCTIGHARFVPWTAFVIALFIALGASLGNPDSNYYKEQARELVKQGISPANQQKALETLLALESDYIAPVSHGVGHWFWFFFIGGTIVCLILSYPPKIVLGLGVGEDKIVRWRRWTRLVLVVVPGFIAANFVYPFIIQVIKRFVSQ